MTPKMLAKLERKELIRIILAQQEDIKELRSRTLDDFVRQLIRSYQ
jgi:hypothetical protein